MFFSDNSIFSLSHQGLDWHGPSANDAWSSLEALVIILEKAETHLAESYKIPPGCKVILIGHSNGGQGTWYMASRYPDRVLAGEEWILIPR